MRRFHIQVVYEDLSIPAPPVDLTTDVNRMRTAGVDLVASCMDLSGNILLSRTMHQDGMASVSQYWLNGYDESAIKSYSSLMQGVYFLIGHVPFESAKLEPEKYPGMDLYLSELAKYFPDELPGEASLAGWIDADMFVTGLRLVGRDLTRSKLIAALNSLTGLHRGRHRRSDRLAFRAQGERSDRLQRLRAGTRGTLRARSSVRLARCSRALPTPSRPEPAGWSWSLRPGACPGRDRAEHGAGDRVTQFLSYAIPGLPYGCVYALMAVGLVLTYQTSGVFNLAYGAQAYASALIFYVCVNAGWPNWAAFIAAVVLAAPALGLAMDRFLYRFIRSAPVLVKLVSALGMLIAIPSVLQLIFGNQERLAPPSLWLPPGSVYFHVAGDAINGTELSTVIVTLAVVLLALS